MANWLKNLVVKEVSLVDRPANPQAVVLFSKRVDPIDEYMKREFSDDKRKDLASSGAALPDGSFPIENGSDLENAIRAIGRAKDPAKAKAHIKSRAKSLGLSDKIPSDWEGGKIAKAIRSALAKVGLVSGAQDAKAETFDEKFSDQNALQESICSILKDENATDKEALISQSLNEFADYVKGLLPDGISKIVDAGIAASIAGSAGTTLTKGVSTLSEDVKKALGLAATATDADVLAAITKRDEDLAKAQHETNVAKMSDPHKAFMDKGKMPKGGKEAFAAMSADERNAHIKDNPMNDNDGDEATKRLAEELKKRDDEVAELRKRVDERDEADRVATFAKRATDLGFKAEFGATIRKAYSGDVAAQAEVEKEIASLRKQVEKGALFAEFGSNVAKAGSALSEAQAKAEELRKSDSKLTAEKALAKVYETNPEILKRVRAESRAH